MKKLFDQTRGSTSHTTNMLSLARSFGFHDNEVTYAKAGAKLTNIKGIYDNKSSTFWLVPELIGSEVFSFNAPVLTTDKETVDLTEHNLKFENYHIEHNYAFGKGFEIKYGTQVVNFGDYLYRWDGDLPKSVPAGSTPASSGGVGMGAWVSVGDASLRNDLIAENKSFLVDDSRVRCVQPFVEAIARSQHSKNAEAVSITDFGDNINDGITDAAPTARAAIAALKSKGGGTLIIPNGDYRFNSTVIVDCDGILIKGGSPTSGGVRIINGTTESPAIQFGDGVSTYYRNSIEGVCFAQADGVTPGSNNCGLLVKMNSNFRMNNVEVFNYPAALFNGIVFNKAGASFISNVGVQSNKASGFSIENSCVDIYFVNVRSDDNTLYGVHITDSEGLYFSNVTAWGNKVNAWRFDTLGANGCKNMFFSNCVGDTSGQYNWVINQMYASLFNNCWGSAQLNTAANTFASGFLLSGPEVKNIRFNNCAALACNNHGFDIAQASDVSLIGCIAGGNYLPGVGNGRGTDAIGHGVYIGGPSNNVRISNGSAKGNTGYGIEITYGAANIKISDFDVTSNTTGTIDSNSSISTKIVDCPGVTPALGNALTPVMAASGVGVANPNPYDCMVYITGGNVSQINIGGSFALASSDASVLVPAGSFISINYSSAPVWKWIGQ